MKQSNKNSKLGTVIIVALLVILIIQLLYIIDMIN